MKNLLLFITIVLMMLGSSALAFNYNVPESVNTVTINGTMATGEWDDAVILPVKLPDSAFDPNDTIDSASYNGKKAVFETSAADYSSLIYLKWDTSNLYLAMEVSDDVIRTDKSDFTQLCFNILNDPAHEILTESIIWDLKLDGTFNVNGGLAAVASTSAVTVGSGSYIVETAIAWSDFGSVAPAYSPVSGDEHGICFVIQDYDDTVPITGGIARDLKLTIYGSSLDDPTTYHTITLKEQAELVNGDLGYGPADLDESGEVNLADFAIVAASWLNCSDADDENCGDYR